jgi:hypothetical protein
VRRGGLIALGVVVTLALIFGLVAFLNSKEDSTIGAERNAPGVAATDATPELAKGAVVVKYRDPADKQPLLVLAGDFGGGDPALVAAGQGVIVERDPAVDGIVAIAYKRRLTTTSPKDPKLREFAEYWLGRGEQ